MEGQIESVLFKCNHTDVNQSIIYCCCKNFKSIEPHLLGEINIWIRVHGVARENSKKIRSMTTLVMPHIFESWQLCQNMLRGWRMSYSEKFEFLWANFRWSPPPSKLEGPHKVILGDFPFFMEQATSGALRATSHTRLRACDYYTSSTFIGGKDRASPSSLDIILEGPTEYVNAKWM